MSEYGSASFTVSKPGGSTCRMTFAAYADYCSRQQDEDPLYVFDGKFAAAAPPLAQQYRVPPCFKQDYFQVITAEGVTGTVQSTAEGVNGTIMLKYGTVQSTAEGVNGTVLLNYGTVQSTAGRWLTVR